MEHIHRKIARLEAENRNLGHVVAGQQNMIEGLMNQNKRLLAVNTEYKSQATRYAYELETKCDQCVYKHGGDILGDDVQTDIKVKDGTLVGLGLSVVPGEVE